MEKYVLSATLINALQQYLVKRPFEEVANLVLALQQQVAPQMPKEAPQQEQKQASKTEKED